MVYLDHAATTPLDPRVAAAMADPDVLLAANPASNHVAGRESARIVERARAAVAALIGARSDEVIFTSGATESDNLAIQGAARYRAHRGRHLVTMRTEHKAVTDTFRALEKQGFEVTWVAPETDGRLSLDALDAALRPDTQLVSVMHVNNETGIIQDVAAIGALCRSRGILYHCDAAQSAGKLELDVEAACIDLTSVSAHKLYGPQGVGALYVADRAGVEVEPLLFGGGQEKRLRPGTLPVRLIAGFGKASALAVAERADDLAHTRGMRKRLWQGIRDLPDLVRNGDDDSYPGIVNVSAAGVEGESLMLGMEPVCVASGSACNSASGESSYVLRAMGRSDVLAQSAIRFSFGRGTSDEDIDVAIERYRWAVAHLRAIAPAA